MNANLGAGDRPAVGWSALSLHGQVVVLYRLVFAALILVAVLAQLINQIDRGTSIVNFFSFFTIQANLIFMVVLFAGAWIKLAGNHSQSWDLVRGGAASYMITTGVVYVLLLSGLEEDLQTTLPWVNGVLHYWMPLAALVDWLLDRPEKPILFRSALAWLIFPLAWLAYTLLRAASIDWWPYPFLDPDHEDQGYAAVAITTVIILVAFIGLTWLMARTSGLRLRSD